MSCHPSTTVEPERTRQSVQAAIRALRGGAPEDARRIEGLLAAAERAAVHEGYLWRRRLAEDPGQAWMRALFEARRALAEHHDRRRDLDLQWQSERAAAEFAVARARREIESPGMGRADAKRLVMAEGQLSVARDFAADGALARALEAAERAQSSTEPIHQRWRDLHARFADAKLRRSWRQWVDQTVETSRAGRSSVLVVDKLRRRLEVYSRGQRVAEFQVELGSNGLEPKRHAGDRATPEGEYRVTEVRHSGATRFYKALLLNYPNAEDRKRFEKTRATLSPGVGPGSLIEIHGEGGKGRDWTDGCIALSNPEMDRLVTYVKVGTPVTIVGTYD